MNWLAHSLLSKTNIDYQLGNILADPLRGRAWQTASLNFIDGMKMHQAIDKFTDNHDILSTCKARLGDDGHLKGVVLDILFDHYLSNSWYRYCGVALSEYVLSFNQRAQRKAIGFPPKAQRIVSRMAETNLLGRYKTIDQVSVALARIDQRLSARARAKETATQYVQVIEQQYVNLAADFHDFFPELVMYFKEHPLGSSHNHFLL